PTLKTFFCASRRGATKVTYQSTSYPSQTAYAPTNQVFTVGLCDYAGCNGNVAPANATTANPLGLGPVVSQLNPTTLTVIRSTVQLTDIIDGTSYTILLGEKALNPRWGLVNNEDDQGYASGFYNTNLNTIRFTDPKLMPIRDFDITSPLLRATGGA